MRIESYDGLNRTPALGLALKGQLALLEVGLCDTTLNVFWDQNALVAFDEADRPVGVLTWKHQDWAKQIDVAIGYVEPDHRRKGVYGLLWLTLVEKARAMKIEQICSSTHMGNHALRAAAAAQGRQELGVALRFQVPPAQSGGT